MAINLGPSGNANDDEPMTEMNMTPLIDVMLVLLIMLIVTIPIQDHTVELSTPVAAPTSEVKRPVVDVVDIEVDGTWLWNGAALPDRAALEAKLRAVATQLDQDEVHLRADKAVEYKWVAAVLASAQRLGVVKLAVVDDEQVADDS